MPSSHRTASGKSSQDVTASGGRNQDLSAARGRSHDHSAAGAGSQSVTASGGRAQDLPVRWTLRLISVVHALMAALFACASLTLIAVATRLGWLTLGKPFDETAAQHVIEAVGFLAAAVVALQIAQTIAEEEVIRAAHVSGPTRVRRFLSRFMVVLVVALAIEGLVATFRAVHENPTQLPAAASILVATAALLAGWGIFIRLNRYAEELEPEAMEEAKREDEKLK